MAEGLPTMRLEPFHMEHSSFNGGFSLAFHGDTARGNQKRVVLEFDRWWLRILAAEIGEVLREEEAELSRLRTSMENSI